MSTLTFPKLRLRRLRTQPALRRLVHETQLSISDVILPLFIHHGQGVRQPIASLPGQFQLSVDQLDAEISDIISRDIPAVLLFGIPEEKDQTGQVSCHEGGVVQRAIRKIKSIAPDLLVITDVCVCDYTEHGHCGVLNDKNDVDNDATLKIISEQALSHVRAGADVVAPSGMMDGMVHALRETLDENGFKTIPILSYALKYASSMYGPFRDAIASAPKFGDRNSHQINPANIQEGLREVAVDIAEGADMVMVKPAHTYLDMITRVKQAHPHVPLCAYHVSGEYAMIKAASAQGMLDEKRAALEVLTSIKRAGADMIITYFAKDLAEWITK